MATYTENYNLKMPSGQDAPDVEDFNTNAEIIDTVLKAHSDNTADEYSPDETYTAGRLVIQNNALWKAKQDISVAETWTPDHWDPTTLAAELSAVNSSMNVTDVQIEETITLSTNRVKKSGNVISGSVGFTKSTTGWVTIGTIAAAPFAQYDFPLIRNNDGLHIGILRISENGTISAYSADAAGDVSASFSYISIMT